MASVHLFSHTTSEGGQAFRQRFRFLLPEEERDRTDFYPPPHDAHPRPNPHTPHTEGVADPAATQHDHSAANEIDLQNDPPQETTANPFVQFFNRCLKRETSLSVVVAMGPFKGSLTSRKAGDVAEAALADAGVARVRRLHLSDGGSGFLEAIALNRPTFTLHHTPPLLSSHTPADAPRRPVSLLVDASTRTAVLEAAKCCPFEADHLTPNTLSSRPLGEAILFCLSEHAQTIYVGVGDTGTLDGGIGMAQALGLIVLDELGQPIQPTDGNPLLKVHALDVSQMDARLAHTRIVVGTDVTNPLLGPSGTVPVFGPQKGVDTPDLKEHYETQLIRYVEAIRKVLPDSVTASSPGTGAGGGIAFALATFCGATIRSGFDLVAEASHLSEYLHAADLVITGEGRFDRSSMFGKLPISIARLAKPYKTKVFVFAGSLSEEELPWQAEGIDCLMPLSDAATSIETAIENAPVLLHKAIVRAINVLRIGREVRV